MTEGMVLIKHAAAIHINNILTLNQRKIANILLKNAYNELNKGVWHTIKVKDLLSLLGWNSSSKVTEMLKNDLRVLNTVQLEWNVLKRDKKHSWGVTTVLADAKLENGLIRYSYSLALQEMLYNPNIYAKLNLNMQKSLKTKYALSIWEYIQCELNLERTRRDYIISLEDLKKICGIENKKTYDSFKNINQKLLKPAIAEINEKSDIKIDVELCRSNRKVDSIKFHLEKAVSPMILQLELKEIAEISDEFLISKGEKYGVSGVQMQADIVNYGKNRVKTALEYIESRLNEGKLISNIAAFYTSALKGEWKEQISSEEIKEADLEECLKQTKGPQFFFDIMKSIKDKIGNELFKSWFLTLELDSFNDKEIIIKATSDFQKDYINRNFSEVLREVIEELQIDKDIKLAA